MSDQAVDFSAIANAVTERLEGAGAETAEVPDPADLAGLTPPDASEPEPETVDIFDDEAVQNFDRAYVTKLREEAATHRTAKKQAEEALEGWNKATADWGDDERALARDLVAAIHDGDLQRAVDIIGPEALAEVLGVPQSQVPDATEQNSDRPLTQADLERTLEEREKARQREADIETVFVQARALGYDPDAKQGTPEFGRWVMLHQYAMAAGSIEAGHKQMEAAEAAEKQRVIDEFIASRSNGSPAPAGAAGAASREPDDAWLNEGNPLQASMRRAMSRVTGDRTQVG